MIFMKHALSILTQREVEIEVEIERIKALPNKNKEVFLNTQYNWLEDIRKAKEVLLKEMKS
jgi:hypothetical protein